MSFSSEQKKMLFLSSLGGTIEFYDFVVFVFFAKLLGELFFPSADPVISTMSAFALFAVGYFIRPIGGLIMAHLGDRFGRKKTFIATVILMAVPTFLIGLLPTYHQIGIYAPLLLLVLRILQGFSLGGEIPGAIVFISESVSLEKQGFACGVIFLGINSGLLLGSLVTTTLTKFLHVPDLQSWGWRLPFLIGGMLGIVSFYLRKKLQETPQFAAIQALGQQAKYPLMSVLRSFPIESIRGIILALVGATVISLFYLFMPTYLSTFCDVALDKAVLLNTVAIALFAFFIPFLGKWADKIGYLFVMRIGIVGLFLFSYPIYWLLGSAQFSVIIVGVLMLCVLGCFITATFPCILTQLYTTPVRYTGFALSYNVAYAISGTIPFAATYLIHQTQNRLMPAFLMIFTVVLAFFATLMLNFSRQTEALKPQKELERLT